MAFNLLLKLFFDKPAFHGPVHPPPKPAVTMNLESKRPANFPEWVTNIPDGCFVGISRPCGSIADAREQALDSAISQILQAMGAEYSLDHSSSIRGNIHHSDHELNEKLVYTAKWFARSIQQEIKESNIQQIDNQYMYFVLIYFPSSKIEKMRKLTIGPKVAAELVRKEKDEALVHIRENNGVLVTLTEYEIEITTKNHNAGLITLFAWKVPESSTRSFKGVLEGKVCLKDSSEQISIPFSVSDTNLKDTILGAKDRIKVTLHGYDEIGRRLILSVKNF